MNGDGLKMGFITDDLNNGVNEYISFEDIVLFVQKLDEDNPSLSEVGKFLLKKYRENCIEIPFCNIDEKTYKPDICGVYTEQNLKRTFYGFLEFVARFGVFDDGRETYFIDGIEASDDWIYNNQFSGYFVKTAAAADFLTTGCQLPITGNAESAIKAFIAGDMPTMATEPPADTVSQQGEDEEVVVKTSQQTKAENMQARIIAALACLYTKTDCSKPYEAAETIIQEWTRQADKLGRQPSKESLVKYIKLGLEQFSKS